MSENKYHYGIMFSFKIKSHLKNAKPQMFSEVISVTHI